MSSPETDPSSSAYSLSSSQPSFIDHPTSSSSTSSSPSTEIDSLPSTSDTDSEADSDFSTDDYRSDAEREWTESLEQLELLLTMVLVPYLGKYFGRKAAYWGWAKYMEWQYPVEVVVTNKAAFKGAGAVEAAASL